MRKVLSILLLVFSILHQSTAQAPPNIDSIKRALEIAKEDTNTVKLLLTLSDNYGWAKPDSTLLFGQQALKLASQIHDPLGEAYSKINIGQALWVLGDYLEADKYFFEAMEFVESLKRWDNLISICAYISSNKRDKGDYREALYYSYKGDSLDSRNKPCLACGLFKVITGSIYVEMHLPDSALLYLNQGPTPPWAYTLWLLGRAYEQKGNTKLAHSYYRQSIAGLYTANNPKDLSNACSSLAQLFKKEGNLDSCVYYAKKGYNTAVEGNYTKGIWEIGLLVSAVYETTDARESLYYYKQAMIAKDRLFNIQKTTRLLNEQFNSQLHQQQDEATRISNRNKIRMFVLLLALGFFLLLVVVLYRNNKHKQKAKSAIEKAYQDLKATQAQLIQSEKMASLGELTAGIAHEIQNPLNFINNFSEVNAELIEEQKLELEARNIKQALWYADEIKQNEDKIAMHGKRADAIVKSMLEHSRSSKGEKQLTDINSLVDEYLRLAYHGFRAKDKSFNASIQTQFDETIGIINIVPQDIGRVLLNLFNNAFYAVAEKGKKADTTYVPAATVITQKLQDKIEIRVQDNGMGIQKSVIDKIFQPFFTTKPTGEGTGLGLSLSYDIIKAHGGELKVESREGEGATFTIGLPLA